MAKKATNKQILTAYGQSYNMMQEGKRYDDMVVRVGKEKALKLFIPKQKNKNDKKRSS